MKNTPYEGKLHPTEIARKSAPVQPVTSPSPPPSPTEACSTPEQDGDGREEITRLTHALDLANVSVVSFSMS